MGGSGHSVLTCRRVTSGGPRDLTYPAAVSAVSRLQVTLPVPGPLTACEMPRLERCPLGRRLVPDAQPDVADQGGPMTITCGIDWAEAHHHAALVDHDGKVVARHGSAATSPASRPSWSSSTSMGATHRPRRSRSRLKEACSSSPWLAPGHRLPDQPALGRALPRASQSGRREVRPRRRCGGSEHAAH